LKQVPLFLEPTFTEFQSRITRRIRLRKISEMRASTEAEFTGRYPFDIKAGIEKIPQDMLTE